MKHFYEEPEVLIERFDLYETIALNIWDESNPDIGNDSDGEDFDL
ncbi:MAG: hypothetical protein ACI4DS_01275 [Eubacterium sp.]